MRRPKVLFVTPGLSRFMQQDLDALRRVAQVRHVVWDSKRRLASLLGGMAGSDVVVLWFASDHAWLATLLAPWLRTRTLLITGGNDVVDVPDMGLRLSPRARRRARRALQRADVVLPFSRASDRDLRALGTPRRSHVLPMGVDPSYFQPLGEKEDAVLTAGQVSQWNLLRKGHEPFVRAAAMRPAVPFWFLYPAGPGGSEPEALAYLRSIAPPNVSFIEDGGDELRTRMQRARVYVQASGHEGFGVANAEAMACACVPVVTRRAALPEVVGDTGEYVAFNDPADLAAGIDRALRRHGRAARQRIMEQFPLSRRQERLAQLVLDWCLPA